MTDLMDRFFARIGFSLHELHTSDYRGLLYIGMIFLSGMTTAFIIMAGIG